MKYLIVILTVTLLASCVQSESGKRAAQMRAASPAFHLMDSQGDDSYTPVTYNQVQDYLNQAFTIYSPDSTAFINIDEYDRYTVGAHPVYHQGFVSFETAFKLFYEHYCPELVEAHGNFLMLKRKAVNIPQVAFQMPVD